MDLVGFAKSVFNDVGCELKKWVKGKETLDSFPGKPVVSHIQGLAIFFVFIVIMAGMFSMQASSIKVGAVQEDNGGGGGGKPVSYDGWTANTGSSAASGDVAENGDAAAVVQQITEKNLAEFSATIKWTDEPDHDIRHPNSPDELGIEIVSPWGENKSLSAKNPAGGEGTVTVTVTVVQTRFNGVNGTGDWNVTVFAKDCGDHNPKNVGLLKWLDTGNAYDLAISWKYFTKATKK